MQKAPKVIPADAQFEKDAPDEASNSEEQKERGYYYDDTHGYEIYKDEPNEDEPPLIPSDQP